MWGCEKRDQRIGQARGGSANEVSVAREIHEFKNHLDCGQDDCWVDVGQTRIHSLDDIFSFFGAVRPVAGYSLEEVDLSPF